MALIIVALIITLINIAPTHSVGITLKKYNNIPYALCAASGTRPTNDFMWINGYKYRVGLSECPVITTGPSFANTDLTDGKLTPAGSKTVWSLFGVPTTFPQKQTDGSWVVQGAVRRNYKTSVSPGGSSSNQWSFPCVIDKKPRTATNGDQFQVAICRGPMMENVNNKPIKYGSRVWTEAAKGIPNPIVAQIITSIK